MLGRPFFDAVPEAQGEEWRPLLDGVYRSGEPYVGTEVATHFAAGDDGQPQTRFFDFVWAPLREHGEVQGIIVVASDVTPQVSTRRELGRLREAAEAANQAKDGFLAMLGHELRNPLAPIMTALQLMKLRGGDGVERERAVIERQMRHVVSLVDDLLDVSRITRGKVTLKQGFVELADVVAKAIEMVSPLLEQQRHELQVEVPTSGLGLWGDVDRLAQVVFNILNNAAKYTPPGGRVGMRGRLDGGEVVLEVSDNGVGIAPAMLSRVFDPFVQEGQTLDRSRGGLGLGLAIASSLAELHGGAVTAASEGDGRGSTFGVRLPHQPQPPPLPDEAAERTGVRGAHGQRTPRVLIVDDNVDAAELLAEYLKDQGFDVRTVHDGLSALAAARAFRPDVALVDIGLPVMDGYEVARRLGQDLACPGLRLIAVTGYGQQQDRERSASAGFHEHLVKPVDLGRLETGLREMLPTQARSSRRAG
ncbi:MAG: ATP-binding protein [Rubrivivax sp.]